eukprot:scaffold7949_cov37-Cyclotella_meneghiniana.AAC.10
MNAMKKLMVDLHTAASKKIRQIQRLVYEERTKAHSAAKLRSIEDAHLNTNRSADSFMQSNVASVDKNGAQSLIIFGFQELMRQLTKKDIQLHIDATFTVPKGFYQCLIIGNFSELGIFLICVYISSRPGRTRWLMSWHFLSLTYYWKER